MSINDYLNQEIPEIAGIIFLILFAIMIPLCIFVYKKSQQSVYGKSTGEQRNVDVIVVSKNIVPNPINQKYMINTILFETNNGERIELAIKDSNIYGKIIVGDKGNLIYQGKHFISFTRK